ncbi:MAG: hypothetical protein JWO67_926 [Streptosporangiaceae bacterium]|nr:hypothetical protein [Streptosporangiaceae bacterium]
MLSSMKARLRPAPRQREVDPAKVAELLARRKRIQGRADELAAQIAAVDADLTGMLRGSEEAVAGGKVLFTHRRDGTFASRQFADAHPVEFVEFSRMAPKLDVVALATRRPDLYQRYRARVLRPRSQ